MKKTLILAVVLLVLLAGFLYFFSSNSEEKLEAFNDEQITLMKDFDKYVIKAKAPGEENLCRDWFGRDLKFGDEIDESLIAGATLVGIDQSKSIWKFRGMNEEYDFFLPIDEGVAQEYKENEFYKIDMKNICVNFLLMVDSNMDSKYRNKFVLPTPYLKN